MLINNGNIICEHFITIRATAADFVSRKLELLMEFHLGASEATHLTLRITQWRSVTCHPAKVNTPHLNPSQTNRCGSQLLPLILVTPGKN